MAGGPSLRPDSKQSQPWPTVSIVVNTYNRGASLGLTLGSLGQLDYPSFEVVVVNGPSTDDTEAVLAGYAGRIKIARCPERNLSMSRNLGIGVAAGHIVAFIDDDAYPDPAWLDRLVEAYVDDEVGGTGGPVYDHTGVQFQSRYIISDRIGRSLLTFDTNPSAWLNLPGAGSFIRLIGTNSSFRRDRLLEIGGFDEEFEYFLDETDVCLRLIDAGYVICQLDDGTVYHKFLPSDIRGESRAARDRYSVLKNTCYFALKNVREGMPFSEMCIGLAEFVEAERGNVVWNVQHGLLAPEDLEKFEADIPVAFEAGWEHFLAGEPKTQAKEWFDQLQQPFLPYPALRHGQDKLHVCLISQDYPPEPLGGIGRIVHAQATGLAAAGHVIRVITTDDSHNRVDLEDGVWVHRIVDLDHLAPASIDVPTHIWDHAASVLDELHRIDSHRPLDLVLVPNWDAEGLAVLLEGDLRCALGMYTPMKTVQEIDARLKVDPLAGRIAECERLCYERATAFLASSHAVISEIESEYGIRLPPEHLEVCPLGLPDRGASRASTASGVGKRHHGELRILFVGRHEKRKGIDTLLAALPDLLDEFPAATVTLAGRDDIPAEDGVPYRTHFEGSLEGERLAGRVRFLGPVPDNQLDRLYAECDIFTAPSRYESFGLILLEAMMFAKPVVSCDVGGIREVVDDGDNGFLVPPGESAALGRALAELCRSEELRRRLGLRGRAIYEERFQVGRMVQQINRFFDRLTGRRTASSVRVGKVPEVTSPASPSRRP